MELGERKRRILGAIVHDYVATAEPVGSELLAFKYNLGVKPATIRNEMAAMSELGYLRQPHTSAGRVPSDLGYRYYVDRLMPAPRLGHRESDRARRGFDNCETEVEELIQQTCRILSSLTMYTSVATPPRTDTVCVQHIMISIVKPGKLLVVTVLNTGHVDHRFVDYEGSLAATDAMAMTNLANERLKGSESGDAVLQGGGPCPRELIRHKDVYGKVVQTVRQALTAAEDDDLYMDGTGNILRQPEFHQAERVTALLNALEQRKTLFQILSRALLGPDVTVIIGSENQLSDMRECSFVTARYSVGDRVLGSIGVIGPTRMDYRRAVAAVRFMASSLGEMLMHLGIG